jgi:hypothetical protein
MIRGANQAEVGRIAVHQYQVYFRMRDTKALDYVLHGRKRDETLRSSPVSLARGQVVVQFTIETEAYTSPDREAWESFLHECSAVGGSVSQRASGFALPPIGVS